MTARRSLGIVAAAALAASSLVAVTQSSADAAGARNGRCERGEFCLYYNSRQGGSVSDYNRSVTDYGARQPSCSEFRGRGSGRGVCVRNNAASYWNRTGRVWTVHVYPDYGGFSQTARPGKGNLNRYLKNHNGSHRRH